MVLLSSKMVPLGTKAPDFKLMGIDDQLHSLTSYDEAGVLVVIFMCNHCPYVQKIWSELVVLEKSMPESVRFVGINSNGGNPAYPEDSFEKMKEYAAIMKQEFDYLIDENQTVGKAYDALCTPDFFVYDKTRNLAYRGAFSGLEAAILALLKGEKPTDAQEHSMGCSIKWNT